ncbi:MAG: UMP kinase [Candidatus Paceibacterota bacterium]|jgi:uridylate kinase
MKKYKRILLKLSGEVFGKDGGEGVSILSYIKVAKEIAKIKKENKIELAIVIGAGNIFRGRMVGEEKFDRVAADYMGMIGTIINGIGLKESLKEEGVDSEVYSALGVRDVVESYSKEKAIKSLREGKIVIFAAGTGNPFFTTDSAAALRACEINCDLVLKATNVDGVYDKDPRKDKDAKLYKKLSYSEAIEKQLNVMDITAFTLCFENKKPIIVFNVKDIKNVSKAINGEPFGTIIN